MARKKNSRARSRARKERKVFPQVEGKVQMTREGFAFVIVDGEEDDVFVKSGYVLNPLSSTSEKYFFDEKVGYRENLSSMIEFTDVDENKVSVDTDGIMEINSVNLEKIVQSPNTRLVLRGGSASINI